jgi:deoxyribonuclease IV
MNSIKYGIKLWSTNSNLYGDFIKSYHEKKVDYLELLYSPGNIEDIDLLIKNRIPVVIHAPTFNQNVLFGDGRFEENDKVLKETMRFAEKLNSSQIIIHPDIGRKNHFIKFLGEHKDKRLIIENMPKKGIGGAECIGYALKEIKEYLDIDNFDFCIDFAHAIKSAISQNIDYKKFLKDLMGLNPRIAHISDGTLKSEEDEHMSLGEGDFDLKFIATLIKKSTIEKLTFEVPKTNGLTNDVANMDLFKEIFKKIH